MRRLILAAILGVGLLGGSAVAMPGQAGPAPHAASRGPAVVLGTVVPVGYRGDYRPRHYAPPPPPRAYRRHYAPPPRPYYRQRYVPPQRPWAPPPQVYYRR
jgi:hypothetical protein